MSHTVSSLQPVNDRSGRVAAAGTGGYTGPILWNGRPVRIKCQIYRKPTLGQRMHTAISFLLPVSCLRAIPSYPPEEMNSREVQKIHALKAARIAVPDIIGARGRVLIVTDTGSSIQDRLDRLGKTNPRLHDSLLIRCAEALGTVHAAGLCQGRPHPRDMFLADGYVGFSDFREYPETIMPLPMAQARDIWLLFSQIMAQMLEKQSTPAAAFTAWRRHISLETLESLRRTVHFFRIFIGPLRLARPIFSGDNGKHMLCAMEFFISHLGL